MYIHWDRDRIIGCFTTFLSIQNDKEETTLKTSLNNDNDNHKSFLLNLVLLLLFSLSPFCISGENKTAGADRNRSRRRQPRSRRPTRRRAGRR